MLTETGQVISVDAEGVWVRVVRQSACNACQTGSACGQKSLSEYFSQRAMDFYVSNVLGAREGDCVELGIPENNLVTLAFLTYFMPLLALILGAIIGDWSWEWMSNVSITSLVPISRDVAAIFGGTVGIICGFLLLKALISRGRSSLKREPELIRVISSDPEHRRILNSL